MIRDKNDSQDRFYSTSNTVALNVAAYSSSRLFVSKIGISRESLAQRIVVKQRLTLI